MPLIVAPMLHVSGRDIVMASCRAGVVGAFPTANAGSAHELGAWLDEFATLPAKAAPPCPNLIMAHPRVSEDIACLLERPPELVITSVGAPIGAHALRDAGTLVFADVASIRHARRALDIGCDGLVLLTAGAGGQTGWLNPFAFVREVREFFSGPVVLAGGLSDGRGLRAAEALGCDLGYMGTRFIVARESLASAAYQDMVVGSGMDDVVLTRSITGLPTSFLRQSLLDAGLDPNQLDETTSVEAARRQFGPGAGARRWREIFSAGHSVSGVRSIQSTSEIVDVIVMQYEDAASHPRR